MKLFVSFFFVVVLGVSVMALSDKEKEQVREISESCIKSSKVSMDVIKKARAKDFVEDPKMEEYIYCFFTHIGIQDESGKMNAAAMLEKAPTELDRKKVEKVVEKCKSEMGENPQKTAYLVYKCLRSGTDFDLDAAILS